MMNRLGERAENLVVAPGIGNCMGEVLAYLAAEKGGTFKIAVMQRRPKKKVREFMLNRYTMRNGSSFDYVPCNVHGRVRKSRTFEEQKTKLQDSLFNIMDSWSYRSVFWGDWLKNKYMHGLLPEIIDATYNFSMNLNRYLDQFQPVFVLSQHIY